MAWSTRDRILYTTSFLISVPKILAACLALDLLISHIGPSHLATYSNQLTLYPQRDGDQLRLVADIGSFAAGFMFVGVLFLLPKSLLYPSLTALLGILMILSLVLKRRYNAEVSNFLEADETQKALLALLNSDNTGEVASGIYAVGETKDVSTTKAPNPAKKPRNVTSGAVLFKTRSSTS